MGHLGTANDLVSLQEVENGVSNIIRGLCVVLSGIVILAILAGVVTIVSAGVGLVWEFCCRVVPLVLVGALALGAVLGVLWLIGFVARKIGG